MKSFRLLFLLILCPLGLLAQDSLIVQTLTFDSTWTRRGKWVFPPASEKFRKILMYHTLKCYPGVSGDGRYACGEWDYLTYTFVHSSKDSTDYEIGRFITPYGINLSLGNGFRWVYDVTDYASLLHDTVDLSAGNNQELIDVKFVMIKGTPPAEVNRIVHLSGKGAPSYSYKSLDDDQYMKAQTITAAPGTKVMRVKTRITGHGHNSNDGSFPHCCEWKDNFHYLLANGHHHAAWRVFRYTQCAENPVYPQGGTWPGAREGWCPGDVVEEYEFDVSDKVINNQITLDYDIDSVPANNTGMGGGNYVLSMHLIEYKQPAHALDAEVYEIIKPNNWEYQSRKNPLCMDPRIVLRNAGSDPITSIMLSYGVSGGPQKSFTWTGNLKFLETVQVSLPVGNAGLWVGDGTNKFTVTITKVNGQNDPSPANNVASSYFKLPDIFPGKVLFHLRTNNAAAENKVVVKDVYGNVVFSRDNLTANKLYQDTLPMGEGCYTLELTDEGHDGLSYWANTAAGNGYFRIYNAVSPGLLKGFNADFGAKIFYSFAIGRITNVEPQEKLQAVEVYPNPGNGNFTLQLDGLEGDFTLDVFNTSGQKISSEKIHTGGLLMHPMQLQARPGLYTIRLSGGSEVFIRKLVIQ